MSFDPQPHLIQLPKRVKNPETGKWETKQEDYLEVKWRLCWFRDRYPHGRIETEEVCVDLDRVVTVEVVTNVDGKSQTQTKTGTGYARFKARVEDGEGGVATGYGTENAAEFADFCERAETRSIGRALAGLGIGTQFVGAELSEGEHVADAPVTTTPASSNGHTPALSSDEALAYPTEAHLAALRKLALETCQEDLEAFETRLRRTAGLPAHASLAPKLLCRTLKMTTFMEVYGWYVKLSEQLAKSAKEASRANPSQDASAPPATPAPTEERLPVDPPPTDEIAAGPSSASAPAPAPAPDPGDDTVERERIVKEAIDAGIPEKEARHIVNHHDLKAAERLLIAAAKKRLQAAAA